TAWRESFSSNLSDVRSATSDQEFWQARSVRASEAASQIERQGAGFNQNMDNAFITFMAEQDRGDGHDVGMIEASRRWVSGSANDVRWVREQSNAFMNEVAASELDMPTPDGYRQPNDVVLSNGVTQQSIRGAAEAEFEMLKDASQTGEMPASFDDARADQIAGTQHWTSMRHEMGVARGADDNEKLAQIRTLTNNERVERGRGAEWDEFARTDPHEMTEGGQAIYDRSKRLPFLDPQANGFNQRRDHMPDQQPMSSHPHYSTGADRIRDN
ncbi:MAG: hypothetical protein AAGJ50_09545, partial [Pseudomonadota bacterium]